ncbi:MAG: acyl-CoA oxidase, partial [Chloroflexi bacterium]
MVQMAMEAGGLRKFLDGRWGRIREEVRGQIQETPLLRPVHGLPTEEYRARVLEQETIALVDLSLLVKVGVQYGLFGGVIRRLGTEQHRQRYLRAAMTMDLPGCFAMTETGHGSDVQSIRTTATYEPARQEFIIDTPDDNARKDYIGNAARDGRMAAVFAQLLTGGQGRGVHVFLVPIRDERGRAYRGVRIEDCGEKGGLNGVDNGRLWFDQVRVPREALLDRFGAVAPDGSYTSPIANDTRRFFTMLGTLVSGRVSVAGAGLSAAKLALAIAVRYGLTRRQFRAPGSDREVILLDYLQHQRRLLPALATTYALHFAQEALVTALHDAGDGDSADESEQRRLETLAAGLKAVSTWHTTQTIQTCREACGGAGYLSVNRLTELKADTDVFTTFEG